jgi:hypothetical protein
MESRKTGPARSAARFDESKTRREAERGEQGRRFAVVGGFASGTKLNCWCTVAKNVLKLKKKQERSVHGDCRKAKGDSV